MCLGRNRICLLLCHCRQQGVKPARNQARSWRQLFLIWSNWVHLWLMCRGWSLIKLQGCFLRCSFALLLWLAMRCQVAFCFVFVLLFSFSRRLWIKIFLKLVTSKLSNFLSIKYIFSLDFDLYLWRTKCHILDVS